MIPIVLVWPLLWLAGRAGASRRMPAAAMLMALAAFGWGQGNGRWFTISLFDPAVHVVDRSARFMSFAEQGKAMGQLFEHDPSLRLAIGACGAIPYYSESYGIDLYGLNEPPSEFQSYATGYGPGHARLGNFKFLEQKKPHLVSLRCEQTSPASMPRNYTLKDPQIAEVVHLFEQEALRKQLKIIELPLGNGFVEVCIYWLPHPTVEALIKINR